MRPKIQTLWVYMSEEFGAYLALQKLLISLVDLPDADWLLMRNHLHLQSFQKKEHLAFANQASGNFWFIASGLVRNYYSTVDGKEFNKSFITAPGFCGAMSELINGNPGRFSIQALEEVTALAIPIHWFKAACEESPALEKLAKVQAQQLALKKEIREAALLLDDATERYLQFRRDHPGLETRIPAYQVASYLGITEVALSRIKRRLG